MVMKRAHVFVSGRVQGVFYRAETKNTASRLNLTGWVRNLPDWRVEAVIEGKEDNVDALIDWCRKGPGFASVTEIEIKEEPFTGAFGGFRIRY
jgi:Acylphosphatases